MASRHYVCLREPRTRKPYNHRDAIVFGKLYFQNVFQLQLK